MHGGECSGESTNLEFDIRDTLGCCCSLLQLTVESMIHDPLVGLGRLGDFRLVYILESPRKRAIRHPMPPLNPPGALSPGDSLYASVKECSVPEDLERPTSTWGEKAQDSEAPSLTPQAPVRSALASINIVVACTCSLMISSALGSAVTISLPYMGKDLNIRKGDLQWILSAYSISSVSISCNNISPSLAYLTQACFLLLFGRLADLYGRKFVWLIGYLITGICGLSASFARCMFDLTVHCLFFFLTLQHVAGITLDIMRGIQGIGAAAMIPASVGLLLVIDLPVRKELQLVSLAFCRGHSRLGPHDLLPSQPSPPVPQSAQPSAPFLAVSSRS